MSFAQVHTRSVVGLHAPKVMVEVHLSQGLLALTTGSFDTTAFSNPW